MKHRQALILGLGSVFVLFLSLFVLSMNRIYWNVQSTCVGVQAQFDGNCSDALVIDIADESTAPEPGMKLELGLPTGDGRYRRSGWCNDAQQRRAGDGALPRAGHRRW